jgi:hypothetical protein
VDGMTTRALALTVLGAASLAICACGGDQSKTGMDDIFVPVSAVSEDAYGPKAPDSSPHHDDASSTTSGGGATSGLNEEQKDQLRLALKRGGENAVICGKSVPGNKTFGEGEAQVTFDGSTGHVSEVTLTAPFAGSEIEKCIKQSFMAEYSLRFDGPPITVPYPLKIDKPAGDSKTAPKKK